MSSLSIVWTSFFCIIYINLVSSKTTTISRSGVYSNCESLLGFVNAKRVIENYTFVEEIDCNLLISADGIVSIYVETEDGTIKTKLDRALVESEVAGSHVITQMGQVISGFLKDSIVTIESTYPMLDVTKCESPSGITQITSPVSTIIFESIDHFVTEKLTCTGNTTLYFKPGLTFR